MGMSELKLAPFGLPPPLQLLAIMSVGHLSSLF